MKFFFSQSSHDGGADVFSLVTSRSLWKVLISFWSSSVFVSSFVSSSSHAQASMKRYWMQPIWSKKKNDKSTRVYLKSVHNYQHVDALFVPGGTSELWFSSQRCHHQLISASIICCLRRTIFNLKHRNYLIIATILIKRCHETELTMEKSREKIPLRTKFPYASKALS